ncbi:SOS response-associated peptidase [Paenibacillus allorhizosphaerae]|uniref:Abasic site processing protein n=1 Tax=Paenibacillus allorhizosphaerae TaxID=2849866 RepID=A0ABN7TMX5_9BACL|nr:SOS response-associated peptidase [Paenibacillus allorhizosphaerae]CAG7641637.1 SOS response-associated protein YedK [Paenibacillus allorhizosphaerae]
MCGRYTITVSWDELVLHFLLDRRSAKYAPRYNVAPGQWIPAIIGSIREGSELQQTLNRFGELRWGLVPSWAKDDKSAARMINARSESAGEKPSFRPLLKSKRCIIPADGFYEWSRSGATKQPFRITLQDGGLFGMAALYDTWLMPAGEKLHTCTILTTEANELIRGIHERMPVILDREGERLWLDRGIREERKLLPLLVPYPADKMRMYEVNPKVGRVQYDAPDCIEPLVL